MIKFFLFLATFQTFISSLNNPDHCYDFVSTTVTDACGSLDLSVHCKQFFLNLANSGSPECDNSGCQFSDAGSYFYANVPSGLGQTWTIGLWVREVFRTSTLISITDDPTTFWQMQVTQTKLSVLVANFGLALNIATRWAKERWVYVYAFSDSVNAERGFGTFVAGQGAQYFESTYPASYDMDQHSTHILRIGSKVESTEQLSNLRKMVIFQGAAYNLASAEIANILASVACPNLVTTENPACQGMYVYYKMSAAEVTGGQTVLDSSGNSINASNGDDLTVDGNDCTSEADNLLFNGSCMLNVAGLALSSRGFSVEFSIQTTGQNAWQRILYQIFDDKFYIRIHDVQNKVGVHIDGVDSKSEATCVFMAVSLLADNDGSYASYFCNQQYLGEDEIAGKKLDFALTTFQIGSTFTGKLKEFKIYELPMGKETFTHNTSIGVPSCSSGQFYNSATSNCEPCIAPCATCVGPEHYKCNTCATGAIEYVDSIIKDPVDCKTDCGVHTYIDSSVCRDCATNCETCSGGATTDCTLCLSGFFAQPTTNQCLATCPTGYFANSTSRSCEQCHESCSSCTTSSTNCLVCSTHYYSGSLPGACAQCDEACASCSGPLNENCLTCAPLHYQIIGSSSANPKHCLNACPAERYYFNAPSQLCEPCSDPNCLDCSSTDTCTRCDVISRYYLSGTSCSHCPEPDIISEAACGGCSIDGHYLTPDGLCEEKCGDGVRLDPSTQCDDGNFENGDGCDQTCHIEEKYLCQGGGPASRDICAPVVSLAITSASISADFLLSVSLTEMVHFEDFQLKNFHFKTDSSVKLKVEFEEEVESISGYLKYIWIQLTPLDSIPEAQEISICILTGPQIVSYSPYLIVPSELGMRDIPLPSYEHLSDQFKTVMYYFGEAIEDTSVALILGVSLSQLAVQSSMESLWVLVNVNQMIAFMPLMTIQFPANTLPLFEVLAFLNGDMVLLQLVYEKTVGAFLGFHEASPPYNSRFELLGYESVKLLDNSGVFLMTWVLLFLLLLLVICLRKLCRRSGKCCKSMTKRMMLCVVWSPILRTFIETFLELGFCSFINVVHISFLCPADVVSSCFSLLVLIILIMLPFIVLHILGQPPQTLAQKGYQEKFGEIYKNTQRSENYSRGLYYPLFLMHRYFFIFLVFIAQGFGLFQASLMILSTLLFLYYLVQWRPFTQKVDWCLNILSAVVLIVLYIFCVLFALFNYSSSRTFLGYIFIILVLVLFVVNVITIIVSKIQGCVHACKKRKQKRLYQQRLKRFQARIQTAERHTEQHNTSLETKQFNWGTARSATKMPVISAIRKRSTLSVAPTFSPFPEVHRREDTSFVEDSEAKHLAQRRPPRPVQDMSVESLFYI